MDEMCSKFIILGMMCSCRLIGDVIEHVVHITQGPTSKVIGDDIECGVSVAQVPTSRMTMDKAEHGVSIAQGSTSAKRACIGEPHGGGNNMVW